MSQVSSNNNKSFLLSLFDAFSARLNNQAIAGSIALAGATLLSQVAWKLFGLLSDRVKEALFSVYIIPKNTAQHSYFMAWLKTQPAISTGVMQVNAGARTTNYRRPQRGGRGSATENQKEQTLDFTMIPALGTIINMTFQGCYVWINTGIANGNTNAADSNNSSYQPFGAPFGHNTANKVDETNEANLTTVTTFGSNEELVLEMLRQGKALITKNAHVTTVIHTPFLRQGIEWQVIAERPARKLDSIVLPADSAAHIAKDCSDFLTAEDWYADRGIPYRRGYLLHGLPGCGKTSLVTALAGELKLPIYMLSLATPGLTDTTLLDLLNQTPPHMILLLEDIDAVFDVALKNDEINEDKKRKQAAGDVDETEDQGGNMNMMGGFGSRYSKRQSFPDHREMDSKVRISFAGILNAVDGVAAQTGRLLFMTTNHKEKLDNALIRPGRIDYQMEFMEATQGQIKALFSNFYRPIEHTGDDLIESSKSRQERLIALAASEKNLSALGEQFAARVPGGRYTMAQVQGVFMRYRKDPAAMLEHLNDELERLDEDEMQIVPSLSRQLTGSKSTA